MVCLGSFDKHFRLLSNIWMFSDNGMIEVVTNSTEVEVK